MVSDVTLSGAAYSADRTDSQDAQLASDFDDFLKLLTTQLQHQDPTDPMDTKEFTNQIVQFSQVEQQINQNQKLDDLISLQMNNVSSMALGYVGMDVSYMSSEMNFDGESPIKVSYALDQDVAQTQFKVYDSQGGLVYLEEVPTDGGKHELMWNGQHMSGGTVEPGTYTVRVDAVDADDNIIPTETVVSGRVRGVETQDGAIFLLVGERAVPVSTVINTTLPGGQTVVSSSSNNNADDQSNVNYLTQDQIDQIMGTA